MYMRCPMSYMDISNLITAAYETMSKAVNPYGDGQACRRIVRVLSGEDVECYGC